ncbi:MAG: PAS domain S-box protein, partial [Isosphaeraceae bacterium]
IVPIACAGDQKGYLDGIKVYADERPEGRGPVGVCFRTGKPCIIHDFVGDPRTKPWRERAIAHGLHSAAALPLRLRGEVRGVFIVYAGVTDVFQDREVGLLQEIADSVSFAMDHLDQEEKRRRAEESLRHREAQYRAVIETCADGFWMANEEGRILEVNDAYARRSGYGREELVGMPISDLQAIEQPEETAAHVLKIRQNGTDLFESLHRAKDGTIWPVEVNAAYWPNAGGRILAFLRDITSRKQAEEALVERARLAALGADIGTALTRGDTLREMLRSCSEAVVQHLDAAFARIWTLNPEQDVLELQASAGMYTHIDGPHGRIPVGHMKVGLIAQERRPHLTNAVIGDPRVSDQEWAQREGMVSFAGYPLVVKDRLIGVIALFARRSLTHATLQAMASVADEIALGIEQKRAEEALRDSEAKLQAIVNTAVDAIITIDVQGTVLSFNPSAERVFGFAADEVLGRNVSMLMPLPHSQEHGNYVARYIRTGERRVVGFGREIPAQRKDGTVFPMEIGVSEIRLGGKVIFVGMLRDISERKAAEEQIRKLNANLELMVARRTAELESMLANATIGLAFIDRHLRFLRVNRTLAEYTGVPVEDHLGRTIRELDTPLADQVEPVFQKVFETGQAVVGLEHAVRGFTPPHEVRQVLASYYPVLNAQGEVICAGTAMVDITDRKRAEEGLAELNLVLRQEIAERERVERQVRLLAAVLEASPDLVGIADPSGRVIHLNRAFIEALGRSPETEPLMIRDCHPPEALRIFEEEGLPTAARLGVWRGETEFVTWDGRSIPMSQLILGHSDTQGSLQFYSTIMRDISERKQMEEALRTHGQVLAAANAELARAARLKDEFLANMSHELRTPLNGILSISQGLYEQAYGTMNSRQQDALHDVEECGRHLLSLINDILDLAKVEAGKIEVEPGPMAVEQFCQAAIRLVKESAQKKRLRLSLHVDESVGVLISDERRLKQILVNLLSNAVKFTAEGGEVALEVAGDRAGRQVCFTVRDSGIGICPEDLARLFQPFVQLDSRLSRTYSGTGLGLALVKRLTTLLGGDTRVDSQPGVGSRFTIVLPWIEESRAIERESTLAEEPGDGRRRADESATEAVVVVIEDNPFNAKGLCDYLCFKGFRVEWALNALDGIALTQRLQPSLVVMDIQMPGMDGLEAIQRIRQLAAVGDVPIIALTALAMPGDRERCLKAGATDYIAKPVALDDFFQLATKLTSGTCTTSG